MSLKFLLFTLNKVNLYKKIQFILTNNLDNSHFIKFLENNITYLIEVEKKYKSFNISDPFYNIIFLQLKIKMYHWLGNFREAKELISNNKNLINSNISSLGKIFHAIFSINIEYLNLENEIGLWEEEIGKKLNIKIGVIQKNNHKLSELLLQLDSMELNSQSYLKVKEQYVELKFSNLKLKNAPLLEEDIVLKNIGNSLLSQINIIKNKIIYSNFISLDENNNIYYKKSSKNLINLYNKLLVNELKIHYYLGEERGLLFKNVQKIIISLVNAEVSDPLLYIKQGHLIKCREDMSCLNLEEKDLEENLFDYYLKCFNVLLYELPNNKSFISLKQFNKAIPDNAVKKIKVNSLDEIKSVKQMVNYSRVFSCYNCVTNHKITNFLSVGLILYYLIIVFFKLYSTVSLSLQNHNYNYGTMLQALSNIFYTHSSLLILPLGLMIYIQLFKKINLFHFALIIFLTFQFNIYHFIDNELHQFLFSLHLYDFLLRENQQILNPQYTKLFLYLLLIISLFITCLFKRFRSLDRIFILIISSSVLITTIIFHFALPMGYFKYAKHQQELNLVQLSSVLSQEQLCHKKHCFIINDVGEVKENINNSKEELLKRYSYYFNALLNYDKNITNKITYHTSLGDFSGLRFDYIITVVKPIIVKDKVNYLVVMDEDILKKYSRQSEMWFSFLSSIAHSIWIFGGFLLLCLHKYRFFKNRKKV